MYYRNVRVDILEAMTTNESLSSDACDRSEKWIRQAMSPILGRFPQISGPDALKPLNDVADLRPVAPETPKISPLEPFHMSKLRWRRHHGRAATLPASHEDLPSAVCGL